MDLTARSLDALDWPVLLDALARNARTPMGQRAARRLSPCASAADARAAMQAVAEVRALEDAGTPVPVGGVGDVGDTARRAAKGEVLEPETLREAAGTLRALRELGAVLYEESDTAPILGELASRIDIDGWVSDALHRAFDPTGQLSGETYPELAALRTRIGDLHEAIRRRLDELVKGDELGDVLQDRYVTMRGDRYVIPIKAHAKNWNLGIVHGTSGSGATVFVEPTAVVAINNELRVAEGELAAAERRILTELSLMLGRIADAVLAALDAAVAIDLACARDGLARALRATRPQVSDDGVVRLRRARHPVLQLRGVAVVPNDLMLTPEQPILVITGPNTGGKTVALKTIGLCVLLVRHGCWVPADDDSRVDFFAAVLADIGDAQTVREDLSSFSAHLVVLREVLATARPGCLFLLDELASGTDPAQGGPLARAVLERLLDAGPRVVVTTHYAQLKGLASADPRFALAAMDYSDGRPTYRLVRDATGESHALDTALRMGLDRSLIDRALALMGESERAFSEALEKLDVERQRHDDERRRYEAERDAMRRRLAEIERRGAELEERARAIEEREAGRFLERLKSAEKAIAAVVADLQRAPSHDRVAAARATVDALRGLAPVTPEPEPEPADVGPGDRVRVRTLGDQVGEVVERTDGVVQVRVGALVVRARPEDLERLGAAFPSTPTPKPRAATPEPKKAADLGAAVRVPANTLDLRGLRVEEAFEATEKFFSDAAAHGYDVVFLLHGHGTGALKDALRRWLHTVPAVGRFAPATAEQGGDAFTVIALR